MQISSSCFDIYTGDQLDGLLLGKNTSETTAAPCPNLPEANETTPKVVDYRALGFVGPVTLQVNQVFHLYTKCLKDAGMTAAEFISKQSLRTDLSMLVLNGF